jgi:hypothetical protein
MNNISKKLFFYLTLCITIGFTSCEDSSEALSTEVTIENKIEILKSSEWLLKGFEDRIMYTFSNGKRYTFYGTDNVFSDEAIPGTEDYTITGDMLTMDFHFGNVYTFEIKVSCDNNIVEFYKDGELNTTLYRRDSNYKDCVN